MANDFMLRPEDLALLRRVDAGKLAIDADRDRMGLLVLCLADLIDRDSGDWQITDDGRLALKRANNSDG